MSSAGDRSSGFSKAPPETVLIIEDDAAMRSLLAEYAGELGLVAAEAENGLAGLARAREMPPDVILLDVHLPILDGRKILTLLKEDAILGSIPVIVISGLEETEVAARCIENGAEDYLSKPVNPTLLYARLRSSLERRRMRALEVAYRRQIEAHARELEEHVRAKTRSLADAHERLELLDRAKDEFLSLIAHELRTPVTGVLGATQALASEQLDEAGRGAAANLLSNSVDRLLRIVEDALLLTRIRVSPDPPTLQDHPLPGIWAAAIGQVSAVAVTRNVRIAQMAGSAVVKGDPELLRRALGALLECAIRFSAPGQTVQATCCELPGSLQVRIESHGDRIPADVVPTFFEVLSLTARPITPGGDFGLAPAVAAQILQIMGGSASVIGTEEGTVLIATLGRAPGADGILS